MGADRLWFGSVNDPVAGNLRVLYNGTVEWKLTLTADLARELAHVLARARSRDTH
jgi:hypothetical protein